MRVRPPNILWFCSDQQRHDTVAALGNDEIRTPNLDRLCRGGWAFRRAYAQSPICTPSRASMMTGRYPASHHVHRNGTAAFPDGERLVTGILAEHGYDCGLVGKLHLSAHRDIEVRIAGDGFSYWEWNPYPQNPRREGNSYARWLRARGAEVQELFRGHPLFCGAGVPVELHQTTWAGEMARRFIERAGPEPWMLMVNVFDPHPPFDPPQEYLQRYDVNSLTPPIWRESDRDNQEFLAEIPFQTRTAVDVSGRSVPRDGAGRDPNRPGQLTARPPARFDGRAVKAAYYAMVELIDHEFGSILDLVRERGMAEETLVIFTSDHGEMLGDHGLLYKGCRFLDPLVRVPLVMCQPGIVQAEVTSDALVELVDLAPTMLEAAGLDAPARMQGKSFWSLIRGEGDPHRHKEYVVSEYNDGQANFPPEHGTMVFDGRIKSCFYQSLGLMEVYDHRSDPNEHENLVRTGLSALDRAAIVEEHFRRWLATSDAGVPRSGLH